ncbi:TOBE domain-containing protein [Magnetospirillum molischianum]|uniref:Molybdenum-pterin-binding protein mopA n=1 Tax=Magnetospirillum molischianum DSM 120 TaxID=1150626 RepID=H8FSW8_MAGML|nr:TOBE domain-containing protein [Magnetospirillum molischianum]CCG41456.1 Molybdenum-pterin-binding protein mopA [Magnetospirillum molischianum DSM 120]
MDGNGDRVEAIVALRGSGRSAVGRERIRLLEQVVQFGSISKAAQAVGISYKGAWEALNAVNNLLPRPAVVAQAGGRHGGGAVVTDDGLALIAAFHQMETQLERVAALFSDDGTTLDAPALLRRLGMRTTARNTFRCRVEEIRLGRVNAEVGLRLTDMATLTALITIESLRDLGIRLGQDVTALVTSSFVMLAEGVNEPKATARNRLPGTVVRRTDGPVSSEICLDIGGGKTIAATVTRESADALALFPGRFAWALFKASHVIIAID